jgi:hypothetical protein
MRAPGQRGDSRAPETAVTPVGETPPGAPSPPAVRLVPARWLMVVLAVLRMLLEGRKLTMLGIAGLAWSFTPRRLKLVAAGLAVAATVVVLGALAAITLLALELS